MKLALFCHIHWLILILKSDLILSIFYGFWKSWLQWIFLSMQPWLMVAKSLISWNFSIKSTFLWNILAVQHFFFGGGSNIFLGGGCHFCLIFFFRSKEFFLGGGKKNEVSVFFLSFYWIPKKKELNLSK